MRVFVYFVILVVAAAIIGGFFIVGSPAQERLRKFDEQKIANLQTIQKEITNYWKSKQKLPAELAELNDSLRGFAVPQDPQTGAAYEYQIKDAKTFELCATFSKPSADAKYSAPEPIDVTAGGYYGPEYWQHSKGRTCFERTIDPDFFPPVKN